ncbi:MAG: proprotein convertase P-domain-containing protein [Gemmataceae bacterium]|nr:proprotein convertase P-domain-containing protein [Gemmataceae bacterium]
MKRDSFFSILGKAWRKLRSRRGRRPLGDSIGPRLTVEALEERVVMSVLPPAVVSNQQSLGIGVGPQVAIDPLNPQKIVAVASAGAGTVINYSTDGGYSWGATGFGTLGIPNGGGAATGSPSVSWSREIDVTGALREYFFVVTAQHDAANTAGAIVLTKWDFTGNQPFGVADTDNSTLGPLLHVPIYTWIGADPAFHPTVGVDNNLTTYTDPQTGATQTDSMATLVPRPRDIPGSLAQVPKAVYVAWNVQMTGASSPLRVAASDDGGFTFTTHQFVADTGNGGPVQSTPQISFMQGTVDNRIPGGQLTFAWSEGAGIWIDGSQPDGGAPFQPVASAQIFNSGELSLDPFAIIPPNGPSPGRIRDAIHGGTNPDLQRDTTFELPVNITDPNFDFLRDLDVTISVLHPHLNQLRIELISPDGVSVPLLFNKTNQAGVNATTPDIRGVPDNVGPNSGLANVPPITPPANPNYASLGSISGSNIGNSSVGTVFDDDAARTLFNVAGTPYVSHFRPEGGLLSVFNGRTPAELNGTWQLRIVDFRNDRLGPNATAGELYQFLRAWQLNFTAQISTTGFGNDSGTGALTVGTSATDIFPTRPAVSPTVGIQPGPSFVIDNTLGSFSPFQGRMYVAYTGPGTNSLLADDTDVFVRFSDDGGNTWSRAVRVNDDSINDHFSEGTRPQFLPALAIDPTTGTLVIMYYDARWDASRARPATFIQTSIDGGLTWSPATFLNKPKTAIDAITGQEVFIEPIPNNLPQAGANGFGNHQGLAVYNGRVIPIWSGNENAGGAALWTADTTIAAGPRVVNGDMGPVVQDGSTSTYNTTFTADGTRQLDGFVIEFDRFIDPSTLGTNDISLIYRAPNTPTSQPGTNLSSALTGLVPLELDPTPTPYTVSVSDAITGETAGTVTFRVFLNVPPPAGQTFSVDYTTASVTAVDGVDYTLSIGTVTFNPGETEKSIVVPILDDATVDGTRTFVVNLSNPFATNPITLAGLPTTLNILRGQGTAILIDDETVQSDTRPTVHIGNGAVREGNNGQTDMTFTVVLSRPTFQDVTLTYTTTDGTATGGTDYRIMTGTVTILAGQTTATIAVPVFGDTTFEITESFFVTLGTPPLGINPGRMQGTGFILDDDSVFPVNVSLGDAIVREADGATALVPVFLSAPQTTAVLVRYTTGNGSATGGDDFTANTDGLVFIPAGQMVAFISVPITNDTLAEGNETFTVTLFAASGGMHIGRGAATVLIADDEQVPAISVGDVTIQEGDAGTVNATFTVYLSAASSQSITVQYQTADDSAVSSGASPDYNTLGLTTLTFAPGETAKSVTVKVNGDQLAEGNEQFFLNLSNPIGAIVARPQGVGTIVDDDDLALSIGDVTVQEGTGAGTTTLTFTAYLNAAAQRAVAVNVATSNVTGIPPVGGPGFATAGVDYVANAITLNFAPGVVSQTFTVTVNRDAALEPNEILFATLSNPVGARILRGQAVGTIVDDDTLPTVTIGDAIVREGNAGTTNVDIPVYLSFPVLNNVDISYQTFNDTAVSGTATPDYVAANSIFTFLPGTTTGVITLQVQGDFLIESATSALERFRVQLTGVSTNAILSATKDSGYVTIVDNDVRISIGDVSEYEGNAGTTTLQFPVYLNSPADRVVTATVTSTLGTVVDTTVTFQPGEVFKRVRIQFPTDTSAGTNVPFTVSLSNVVGADPTDTGATGTASRLQANGLIVDDDTTGSTIVTLGDAVADPANGIPQFEGSVGTTPFLIPVFLTANTAAALTLNYTSGFGSGSVTIPANSRTANIQIDVPTDTVMDTNRQFFVTLAPAAGVTFRRQSVSALIIDDDGLAIAVGDPSVVEGNAGTTTMVFPVVASNPTYQYFNFPSPPVNNPPVTATYSTSNLTASLADYVAAVLQGFTFPTSSLAVPVTQTTIDIPVTVDNLNEGNEQFQLDLTGLSGAADTPGSRLTGVATIVDDDDLGLTIGDVTLLEGDAGTTTATFQIFLSAAANRPVTVFYRTADFTAVAPTDYTAVNSSVTFAAGETIKTVSVLVNGNTTRQPNRQFAVNLTRSDEAGIHDAQGVATIIDNDAVPAVSVGDATTIEGNSGTTAVQIPVYLSFPSPTAVVVNYTFANGTATGGTDYDATAGAVTFAPGETVKFISVPVNGDTTAEGNEHFFVDITANFSPSGPRTPVVARARGQVTIVEDDTVPALSIGNAAVREADSGVRTVTFTVYLSAPVAHTVTVQYATADGTATSAGVNPDYLATAGTLTFAPGETAQTVTVTIDGDATMEGDETFFVNLSAAAGANIAQPQGVGTIADDDTPFGAKKFQVNLTPQSATGTYSYAIGPRVRERIRSAPSANLSPTALPPIEAIDVPTVRVNDVTVVEGASGTTTVTFTATLSFPSIQRITVEYTTADGTATAGQDYVGVGPTPGLLVFEAGETVKTVTITVNGDTTVEGNETFFLNLSNPNGAIIDRDRSRPANQQGRATIIDDDFAAPTGSAVSLGDVTVKEQIGTTPTATFTVTRTGDTSAPAAVHYTVTDGTARAGIDYVSANGLTVSDAVVLEGTAPGTVTVTFTVYMTHVMSRPVSVNYFTSDGSAESGLPIDNDFVPGSGTITFAPGETVKTVTVTVNNDTLQEGNEIFFLNLINPQGGVNLLQRPSNPLLAPGQGQATILDDDFPSAAAANPAFHVSDPSFHRGVGAGTVTFRIYRTGPLSGTQTVNYQTVNDTALAGIDYVAVSSSVTFNPGETFKDLPAVTILEDRQFTGNRRFFLQVTNPPAGVGVGKDVGTATLIGVPGVAFAAGETTKTITIQLLDDGSPDGNEDFLVTLLNPSGTTLAKSQGKAVTIDAQGVLYRPEDYKVNIPLSGTTTSSFNITNVPDGEVLRDLTVFLTINHPAVEDLLVELIAPNGAVVILSAGNSTGANFLNTVFDDRAALPIGGRVAGDLKVQAPFRGSFKPDTYLGLLNGIDPNGTWTLRVTNFGGAGTLVDWGLNLQTGVAVTAGASGNFMDQNQNGLEVDQTRTPTDQFAVPEPLNGVPGQLPYDPLTLPLIIPGPHPQLAITYPPESSQLNLRLPQVGEGGTGAAVDTTRSELTIRDVPVYLGISDINVNVSINHMRAGDLKLTLIGPDGTAVVLTNQNGGSGPNFDRVTFDDDATGAINAAGLVAPFKGAYRPQESLSKFFGKTPNGKWTLVIEDLRTGNIGTLVDWSLTIHAGLVLNNTTSSTDVMFDRDIQTASFTPETILRVVGPAGVLFDRVIKENANPAIQAQNQIKNFAITPLVGGVPTPAATAARSFRITFLDAANLPMPQVVSGTYTIVFGPDVFRGGQYLQSVSGDKLDVNLNAGLAALRGVDPNAASTDPVNVATPSNQTFALTPGAAIDIPVTLTDNFVVQGATVQLNITHGYTPALEAFLIAPDGSQVRLFTRPGDAAAAPGAPSASNLTDTILSDIATTSIQDATAPFQSTFAPQQALNTLRGVSSIFGGNGKWTLRLINHTTRPDGSPLNGGAGVAGVLNSFSLTLLKTALGTGLGETVADQFTTTFRIFTQDPTMAQSQQVWTAVGPASLNDGRNAGRVSALAVDPSDPSGNTAYIGAASGGIWKTTNFLTTDPNGPTWVPLTDFGPTYSLNISSIAVMPVNNDPNQTFIIASTGEGATGTPGVGFLRSFDGGRTWQLLDSRANADASGNLLPVASTGPGGRDHHFVGATSFKVVIDPNLRNNNFVIYAALANTPAIIPGTSNAVAGLPSNTVAGGIWRSTDSGNTWALVEAGNGLATDVILSESSAVGTTFESLPLLYAAFQGQGVRYTENALTATSMALLPGGLGNGSTVDADPNFLLPPPNDEDTPIPVSNPPATPQGAKGRIVLATVPRTGDTRADASYQDWLYVAVATPGGTLDGVYMTKDRGDNWTRLQLPALTLAPASGGTTISMGSNDESRADYDPLGIAVDVANRRFLQGNYNLALAVDPNNPNVIFLGGLDYVRSSAAAQGVMRIDVTKIGDPYALVPYDNSDPGGAVTMIGSNTTAAFTLKDTSQSFGVLATDQVTLRGQDPFTGAGGYYNLQSDPDNPFANATVRVRNNFIPPPFLPPVASFQFNNLGDDVAWRPFKIGMTGTSSYHNLFTFVDPLTGGTRVIAGTSEGVFTGVALNDGVGITNIGTAVTPTGSRNGNLQITQFFYGAGQPSSLAADLAGALFYASARENGFPTSDPLVLANGNLNWKGPTIGGDLVIGGDGMGVATDQTGTGVTYQYKIPSGFFEERLLPTNTGVPGSNVFLSKDFLQRILNQGTTPKSITNGLIQNAVTDLPENNQGKWPYGNFPLGNSFTQVSGGVYTPAGANFAINPIDPNGLLISSPGIPGQAGTSGWVFRTVNGTGSAPTWTVIGNPADVGNSYAQAMAFGGQLPPPATGPAPGKNDFIYAGTVAGNVYVSFSGWNATPTWISLGSPGGAADGTAIQQIVPNPTPGSLDVYVVTLRGVYYMQNTFTNTGWVNITNNLFSPALTRQLFGGFGSQTAPQAIPSLGAYATVNPNTGYLTSLAVDWRFVGGANTRPVLYVGGEGGVFRGRFDEATSVWTWGMFPNIAEDGSPAGITPQNGGYLPAVHVTDLDLALGNIDPNTGLPLPETGFNALIATTYGRGTFAIRLNTAALPQISQVSGPAVASFGSSNPTAVTLTALTVTFDGPVDPSTFTLADIVSLTDPNGNQIAPMSVRDITPTPPVGQPNNHNVYEILLPAQTALGFYNLVLGPNISDFAGNRMNQDADLINGEVPDDQFINRILFQPFQNSAPVLTPTAVPFPPVFEDDFTNQGIDLRDFIAGLLIADPNDPQYTAGAPRGIAVTAVDNTNGAWQYSTDGGTIWKDFGAVSASTARLLAFRDSSQPANRIRFVPLPNYFTPPAGTAPFFKFRAWDQIAGSDGSVGNATINGSTSPTAAYSAGEATASAPVIPINDAPAFTIVGTNQTVVEDSGPAMVTSFVSNPVPGPTNESSQTVTFLVTTDRPDLFSAQPAIDSIGTLTFTPAPNASGLANVTVVAVDSGGTDNGGVNTSAPQAFTIDITPVNDVPLFNVGPNIAVAQNTGTRTFPNWATGVSPGAPEEVGQVLTFVIVSNDRPDLFSVQPALDAAGTLTFTLGTYTIGVATIAVRLQDDGGTAGGGVDVSAVQSFTIAVMDANDPPSFVRGPDITIQEDSPPQTFPNWATGFNPGQPDEAGQVPLGYLVTTDRPDLFSAGPSIDAAGTLTFTPAPNAAGTATVTVRVRDNGGTANGGNDTSAPQTFTITLTPVNDAPIFTPGGNVRAGQDAGTVTVQWATNVQGGPNDEAGQAVTFLVTNDNPALFDVEPTIAPNGVLTFTVSGISGTATVTVVAQDPDGTVSDPITFTIAIQGTNFRGIPLECFIHRVYIDLLGRAPDAGGLAFWTGLFENGLSRYEMVRSVLNSPEYRTRFIREQFRVLLRRTADANAINVYMNLFAQGFSPDYLKAQILGSREFIAQHGNGNSFLFLDGVYRAVLRRPLDEAGRAHWGSYLQVNGPVATALAILQSADGDAALVASTYDRYLLRTPDAQGMQIYVQMLQTPGKRDEDLIAGILASVEYFRGLADCHELDGEARWLRQVYLDLLGRPLDPPSEGVWLEALSSGATHHNIVRSITASAEYRTRVIDQAVRALLSRPADPALLALGQNHFASGGTLDGFKAQLMGSAEYYFGHGQGSDGGWLQAVFQDALGHPLNTEGFNFWAPQMATGSRFDVALGILRAVEADQFVVSQMYLNLLRRPVDGTGLGYWGGLLQAGTREEELISSLVSSPEYYNKYSAE